MFLSVLWPFAILLGVASGRIAGWLWGLGLGGFPAEKVASHLARLFVAVETPIMWQVLQFQAAFRLDINTGTGCQPASRLQALAASFDYGLVERRVEEHQVEAANRTGQKMVNIHGHHFHGLGLQQLAVLFERLAGLLPALHLHDSGCPA